MKGIRLSFNGSTWLRVLGTLLTLGLLIYLLIEQGWRELLAALREIAPWRIGLALGLMIVSRLVVSVRWYVLLRSGGVKISLSQALGINFAGLFANNFLLSTVGGDVVRLGGAMLLKFDAAVCAASLVVDRLVGMAGMSVALPVGLPRFLAGQHLGLNSTLPGPAGEQWAAGLASLPLGGLWKKAWDKGGSLSRRLFSAMALWLKQPRALFFALVLTWVHMACLFGFLQLLFDGMGDHLSFILIGGLYSLVYFVTLLPISINGYGLQEVSMTLIFASLGGATRANGLTAALLFRTLMMLTSLPGALFVPGILAGTRRPRPGLE